jgi:hypothetical protein
MAEGLGVVPFPSGMGACARGSYVKVDTWHLLFRSLRKGAPSDLPMLLTGLRTC